MFRQHKRCLSCIRTEIRLASDDSGLLSEHLARSHLPIFFFLMKALKEEPRSCAESFLTAATTFSRKSGSRRTSGVPNRLSDVRESVFRPSHTPSASKNATQRASIRKVVNFSFLYRKLHLDFFPHLQIKVPPARRRRRRPHCCFEGARAKI